MDAFIALLLLILVIWLFGDVLFSFLCRFVAFFICMWLAMEIHHRLAKIVMEMGLTEHPHWAGLISFVVVLAICWCLLRCIGVRVRSGAVGDGEAVALDGFRIGLFCAICLAIFLMLAALTSGQLLLVSWIFLCVMAIGVAGLDVCAPSVMGRAVKWFD
jgi:hypothetical protein